MSHLAETSSYLTGLRTRATTKLTDGLRSDLARTSTSEAMAVLFKLASSPDTAGDALALLHELQVHQVEVDMQHEELRHSRVELENDLIRKTNRFECAPTAYLVIDEATVLCEINQAGLQLLGRSSDEVLGRPLTSFLSDASRERLKNLLSPEGVEAASKTVELELLAAEGANRKLHAAANREASTDRFLLVLMEPPAQT